MTIALSSSNKALAVAGTKAALVATVLGVLAYFGIGFASGFAGEWQWAAGFTSFPLAVVTYGVLEVLLIRRTGVKGPAKVAGLGLVVSVIVWYVTFQAVGVLFAPFEGVLSSSLMLAFIPLVVSLLVGLVGIALGPMIANKVVNK